MKILPITLLLLVLILTSSASATKKTKTIKDTGRPRPEEINSRLYCRACQLMTAEVLKKIGESRSEIDIYEHLPNMCFRLWGHPTQPPQDILKACWAFIDDREDMVAEVLKQRESAEQAIDMLCDQLTKACEGVNLKMPGMGFSSPQPQGQHQQQQQQQKQQQQQQHQKQQQQQQQQQPQPEPQPQSQPQKSQENKPGEQQSEKGRENKPEQKPFAASAIGTAGRGTVTFDEL